MGLRSDIQDNLKEAFAGDLSDIVVDFDLYKKNPNSEYDVATGKNNNYYLATKSRGIFEPMPTHKVNGTNILSTDELLIVNCADISFTIEVDDKIVANGINYLVVAPAPVMGAGSLPIIYEAQVRKNG